MQADLCYFAGRFINPYSCFETICTCLHKVYNWKLFWYVFFRYTNKLPVSNSGTNIFSNFLGIFVKVTAENCLRYLIYFPVLSLLSFIVDKYWCYHDLFQEQEVRKFAYKLIFKTDFLGEVVKHFCILCNRINNLKNIFYVFGISSGICSSIFNFDFSIKLGGGGGDR
jgi:hypothetical protein